MGTYKIVRFFRHRKKTIKTGVTLEEAQAHCEDPESSYSTAKSPEAKRRIRERGAWFDGYTLTKEK
jgi:hypothetical protein